jgi:hypothetical protein
MYADKAQRMAAFKSRQKKDKERGAPPVAKKSRWDFEEDLPVEGYGTATAWTIAPHTGHVRSDPPLPAPA